MGLLWGTIVGVFIIFALSGLITLCVSRKQKDNSEITLFSSRLSNTDISLKEAVNDLRIYDSFVELVEEEN